MVLPEGYDGLTAVEKQEVLWKQCAAEPYDAEAIAANSSDAPAFQAIKVFIPQHTHVTFLNASDEMPEGRQKVIHARGSAAKFELRVAAGTNAPFTGMFAASSVGVMRFSMGRMAHPPFTPAAALKLLIDGQKVCNFTIDGQDKDPNFFRHTFSNSRPPPVSLINKAINGAFTGSINTLPGGPSDRPAEAKTQPQWDAAKISPDGTPVQNVVEPHQIFFTPNEEVTKLYETVMDQDFRLALQSIQPGTVLWELSGKRTSDEAEKPVHIGQLVVTSPIVASSYCDDTLFFQHMRHRRP